MDTIARVIAVVVMGLLYAVIIVVAGHEEAPSGPQCTVVYPRGYADHQSPDDGPACGDIAQSWHTCGPRYAI